MFEQVVSALLSRYLGDYVEGLARENLEINLLGGHVVLENLALRKEAFTRPHLPLAIQHGRLGKLVLDIPWQALGSKPVRVLLEDVFLLAYPTQAEDYDAERAEAQAAAEKRRRLDLAEAIAEEVAPVSAQKKKSYTQRITDKALSMFHVEVRHVHLRYEDNGLSNPGASFALGVTLESFSATTLDQVQEEALQRFAAQLRNLSVYWNPRLTPLPVHSLPQLNERMRALIYLDQQALHPTHHYLLQPVCGSLDLQLNKRTGAASLLEPKLTVDALFESFRVGLQEAQWKQFLYFSDYLTLYSRGMPFRALRPAVRPPRDPLAWWRFVLAGRLRIVRAQREACTWKRITQYKRRRQRYIHYWHQQQVARASQPGGQGPVPETVKQRLLRLEDQMSLEDILLFRSLARAAQARGYLSSSPSASSSGASGAGGGGGWLSWGWSSVAGGSSTSTTSPQGGGASSSSKAPRFTWEQWRGIYEEAHLLGEAEDAPVGELPAGYVQTRCSLTLNELALDLLQDPSTSPSGRASGDGEGLEMPPRLMHWHLRGLVVKLAKRPTSLFVAADIESIGIHDYLTLQASHGMVEMVAPMRAPALSPPQTGRRAGEERQGGEREGQQGQQGRGTVPQCGV